MLKEVLSIILAAGRGSRMKGYDKNKTALSLFSQYEYPIIMEILKNTPAGYKLIILHYKKKDIINITSQLKNIIYCEQPELNGTGGAILAAYDILKARNEQYVVITMGDVPLVKRSTYNELIKGLDKNELMVLGFIPKEKKQYGILDIEGGKVNRIIEWSIWKNFPQNKQQRYSICNSGIYAVRKDILLRYIPVLSSRPHIVIKERGGVSTHIKEYFLTDIVEYMRKDNRHIGYSIANEEEVMGVDDPISLNRARQSFISKREDTIC